MAAIAAVTAARCTDESHAHSHAHRAHGHEAKAGGCDGVLEAAGAGSHAHRGFAARYADVDRRLGEMPAARSWACLRRLLAAEGHETKTLAISLLAARSRADSAIGARAWADQSPAVRAGIVLAWSRTPGRPHLDRTREALGDDVPDVRAAALVALREHRDRADEVAPDVEARLADDSALVRGEAAATLGLFRRSASCPAIARALGDGDDEVRVRAIYAVKNAGCADGRDALLGLVGSEAKDVRGAAILALGVLREPRAVDPIERLLPSLEASERTAALDALRRIRGRP